jgi:phage repressor protein C with HTH and peptisase S24 domain
MKIREIIEAAPAFGLKSLPVGTDNAYQAGKDFGTKLLSPSQWFKGSSGGNLDKEQDKEKQVTTQTGSKQYQDSLEKAQFGTTLNTVDVQNLKVIYGKVKSGEIASDDAEKDMAALKAAYDGYNLDQPQRDIVKNIISKV